MGTDQTFEDFVKRQQAEKTEHGKFNPAEELDFWLRSLTDLHKKVESYLQKWIEAGGIEIQYRQIALNEEFCGAYEAPMMLIGIGTKQVELRPIGTMLIGSRGRVDVIGTSGRGMISLLNKNATSARQLVQVNVQVP